MGSSFPTNNERKNKLAEHVVQAAATVAVGGEKTDRGKHGQYTFVTPLISFKNCLTSAYRGGERMVAKIK